ncbi:ribonuclease H-like domain-containing protein [Sphingobacteriaceae bacterium WQ 2009]|uniref:Ribonuclease H-like domain-containing protein n=1 Tax=Rhinopithecimicrobium faecis TaxID=2820698 RepID=A0A8T4H6J3_9SPHI|nr:ribonuclease H-like domain-containing protein [Sphingobacteriaceae bacterium WQ 2009]
MKLHLKKPLAFFDLETTGVNISADRIVEICILKVNPDATEEVYTKKINPGMPIPAESSMFHGIYDEDVKDIPTFKEYAAEIAEFLGDADLAGYNSNKFDVPVLMEEFLRVGVPFSLEGRSFVDVQNIFHQMEQRTLKAAYKFYCNESLVNAHTAEADVRATYEVLKAQIDKYEGVTFEDKHGKTSQPVVNDVEALHQFTNLSKPVDFAGRLVYNDEGIEVFSFGKHKGRAVTAVFEMEPSYYAWMQNGDFPLYTKKCLENLWNRYKAEKKEVRQTEATFTSEDKKQAKKEFQKVEKKEPAKAITNDMLQNLQNKFSN